MKLFSFLEIKFQNGAHLKKSAIFDLFFIFFSHQGKDTNIPSAHILHKYTYLAYLILAFLPYQFGKNEEFIMNGFSLVRFLVLILSRAISEQSINTKMISKI